MNRITAFLTAPATRRVALDLAALVAAVLVGTMAFTAVARGEFELGPARLAFSASPAASAVTVVELPPFGRVEAATHRGPVRLNVRLEEIDVVATQQMVVAGSLPASTVLAPTVAAGLPLNSFTALLWRLLATGLLAAALAGLTVAAALRRRRNIVVWAIVLAVALPAVAATVTYATWDVAAFREPTLHGSLVYAPQIVDIFSTRVAKIERLREEAAKVAVQLAAYYADDRSLSSGGALPGTFRVLHITDLHLDPVGAQLAKSVARSYEASVVVQTGDLPILGAPIETSVFASLIDTSVPLVYIPGNHDSPASLSELRRLGAAVLASGTIEVEGLRIFGVADPVSSGFGVEPDPVPIRAASRTAYVGLAQSLRSGEATPDLVAVHSPLMEAPFVGHVPVVISGHTHRPRFSVQEGTVLLNSGTIGGMPYDPQDVEREVLPYSASVLYFTAAMPRRLIAIDRIDVYPNGSTTVSREMIDATLLP